MSAPPGSQASASQAEQAYDELERRLVTLVIAPGTFLQEKDLVASMGFGRTPTREAVQRLAAHGLLKIYPRKGILVEPLRADALGQVLEARRVLERLLVVKATERADRVTRQKLTRLADAFESQQSDAALFFRLDRELDKVLEIAAGNVFLAQAMAPLHVHCRRLWYRFRVESETARTAEWHAQLARAVAHDDSAGAIRALNGIISLLEALRVRLEARS